MTEKVSIPGSFFLISGRRSDDPLPRGWLMRLMRRNAPILAISAIVFSAFSSVSCKETIRIRRVCDSLVRAVTALAVGAQQQQINGKHGPWLAARGKLF
ncbi:hypothetical protein [Hyphomonas sp. BRH_c22]|uniref:hypothetical protein n=1 Tax=Hyphomonas sp. BRH_c22 TaxID=1629710 RepID=UPI00262CADC4|nr:hypothetical protein [Hyphomonas sp. BRH_c22]